MREPQAATIDLRRRRAATLLIMAVVGVGALTGGAAAQAAPRDDWQNAKQCFQGNWRNLKTADLRQFRSLGDCVSYALRGGQFGQPPSPGE